MKRTKPCCTCLVIGGGVAACINRNSRENGNLGEGIRSQQAEVRKAKNNALGAGPDT